MHVFSQIFLLQIRHYKLQIQKRPLFNTCVLISSSSVSFTELAHAQLIFKPFQFYGDRVRISCIPAAFSIYQDFEVNRHPLHSVS